MIVATIGFNASLWMRHRAMAAARGGWTVDDFHRELADAGIGPAIGTALAAELRDFYYAACAPRMADRIGDDLKIDPDDLVDILEAVSNAVGQSRPDTSQPEHVLPLATVGDLARYLQRRGVTDRTSAP